MTQPIEHRGKTEGRCGAPADGGPCVLPAGHNIGKPDVPGNHFAPKGDSIREVFGWRIVSCSDARHSWVEVEPGSLGLAPGSARMVAQALASVADHAGGSAVLRFVRGGDR